MPTYEIQTRRKGAWQRYIGSGSRDAIHKAWENLCATTRNAARLVELANGKLIVLNYQKSQKH